MHALLRAAAISCLLAMARRSRQPTPEIGGEDTIDGSLGP